MHALRYAFDEAVASLWRGRQSGLLSTATIAVALFVLGVFLLATSNLERLSRDWSRTAELSVYLDDAATPEERSAIERLVAPGALVAGHEYVSKAEALKRFKQTFADLATQTDALEGNPMPASYEVRLNPSVGAPGSVEELAARLRQSPGVADVRYDREWLDRLLSAVTVIRGVGLALSAVLTIAAALTVANVVRLALHARRDEVEIMQLVGAPTVYIRGPFVMEGVLQGGSARLSRWRCSPPCSWRSRGSIWRHWRRRSTWPRSGFFRSSSARCCSLAGWPWGVSAGWWPRGGPEALQNLDTCFGPALH